MTGKTSFSFQIRLWPLYILEGLRLIELSVLALQGDLGNELVVRSSMSLALQSTRQIILFSPHELAHSQPGLVWLTLSSGFVNLWLLQSSAPMYGVPWLGGNLAE
ncbi:hypothetical protein HCH54_005244 [Aspergillus fumigatus]